MVGTTKTLGQIAFSDVSVALSEVVDFTAMQGASIDAAVIDHQLVEVVRDNCKDVSVMPFLMGEARDMSQSYMSGLGWYQKNGSYVKR
jgi:hypothetical protein